MCPVVVTCITNKVLIVTSVGVLCGVDREPRRTNDGIAQQLVCTVCVEKRRDRLGRVFRELRVGRTLDSRGGRRSCQAQGGERVVGQFWENGNK